MFRQLFWQNSLGGAVYELFGAFSANASFMCSSAPTEVCGVFGEYSKVIKTSGS